MTPRQLLTLREAINRFQKHLKTHGYADSTIKNYTQPLRRLEERFGPSADPSSFTLGDLDVFLGEFDNSAKTVRLHRSALVRFWKWGAQFHKWENVARDLEPIRVGESIVRMLKDGEVEAMLAVAAELGDDAHLILTILTETGCRRGGLIGLRWIHVDLVDGLVTFKEKGNRVRTIPIRPQLVDVLARVKERRGAEPEDFVLGRGDARGHSLTFDYTRPATGQRVLTTVKRIADLAGVELAHEVSPHSFRHWLIKRMMERGEPIRNIAAIVGHTDIRTTAGYAGPAPLDVLRSSLTSLLPANPYGDTAGLQSMLSSGGVVDESDANPERERHDP